MLLPDKPVMKIALEFSCKSGPIGDDFTNGPTPGESNVIPIATAHATLHLNP